MFKLGDKVIINPTIPNGARSKHGYNFYRDTMLKAGIFTLERISPYGGFMIGDCHYDEEWLLPVPLFKEGDIVKIKEDLKNGDAVPFGVSASMEEMAGMTFSIKRMYPGKALEGSCLGFDGYKYILNGDEEAWSWSSPMFDLSNYKQLKTLKNESRLQEQESPLRGGSGEIKCGVCCRKHKPRVTVKSVGYQKVIGRG